MFLITKSLNWEILTKNFVTFKRWGNWVHIWEGNCLQKRLEQFADLRGLGKKEGVVVFSPMHIIVFPGKVSYRC